MSKQLSDQLQRQEIIDAFNISNKFTTKKKNVKDDIAEITKKIMKKLYKDLSLQHPYIIDRIKL